MKVVQTRLSAQEYELLRRHAQSVGRTLQESVREAIRLLVLSDRVNPDDPVFTLPPAGAKRRRKTNHIETMDRELYGADPS